MGNLRIASDLVRLARQLVSSKTPTKSEVLGVFVGEIKTAAETTRYVEVKLDGSSETTKKMKIPDSVYKDSVKRNEFIHRYFEGLGYKKIEVGHCE